MKSDDLRNMDDFDRRLRDLFSGNGSPDSERAESLRKKMRSEFAGKQAKIDRMVFGWHVGLGAVGGFAMGVMVGAGGTGAKIQSGIVAVIAILGLVVMKLWYWIMNTKIGVMREIRLLRIDMAAPKTGDQPGVEDSVDDDSSSQAFMGSPEAGRLARIAMVAVTMLGYVAGVLIAKL